MERKSEHFDPDSTHQGASKSGITLAPGVVIGTDAISIVYVRSSGPGGQNVNKRSTKAQLRISLEDIPLHGRAHDRLVRLARGVINANNELVLSADDTRSQARNKQACIDKLKEIVIRAIIEPKARKATKPTRGSVRRRLEEKKQRSQAKQRRRPPEQS